MKKIAYILSAIIGACFLSACGDDDSFTTSPLHLLTFSSDTVKMDTLFSAVPSSTRSFWVYNKSGDGLRCTNIRLEHGNQKGFRVNVDGSYLGETAGYQVSDIEIRNKDSIRVFVELTSTVNNKEAPQLVEDNLIFTLESGVQQRVNLNAYTWDAEEMRDLHVTGNTTISSQRPIIIYGGITVEAGATLTIEAGTTLYFHADAGLEVHGRLVCAGTADKNVVLRGDRLDRMFDYLPYDFVSGQWQGVHLYEDSYDNHISYTDIHSTFDGLIIDASDVSRTKLVMENSTIHNCQGYGLMTSASNVTLRNCQLTNTLADCLFIDGGSVTVNACTLAQFYPFDGQRGSALRFSAATHPLYQLTCDNTLITGYADDELMGSPGDGTTAFNYAFSDCIIRTPEIEGDEAAHFNNTLFENVEDTLTMGRKHFKRIDSDQLRYDFRLADSSSAIGKANPQTAPTNDRDGRQRDSMPDVGAFEWTDKNTDNP